MSELCVLAIYTTTSSSISAFFKKLLPAKFSKEIRGGRKEGRSPASNRE